MEGFCQDCQKKVEIKTPILKRLRNGDLAYVGKCSVCDAEIIKKEKG